MESEPDLFDFDDPELDEPEQPPRSSRPALPQIGPGGGIWSAGGRIAWIAGLILMLSSFMSWYSGNSIEGPTLSVIGWHTGTIGKLVFFLGLALVLIAILREAGIELPPSIPESLVTIALGALGTILVLVRLISIPDTFAGTSGRSIGLWIALGSALAVIAAGLIRAGEDL
ncbi:MAG: hypothetical protein ACM3QU_13830 [Verrucomicrobiota bacterium]